MSYREKWYWIGLVGGWLVIAAGVVFQDTFTYTRSEVLLAAIAMFAFAAAAKPS